MMCLCLSNTTRKSAVYIYLGNREWIVGGSLVFGDDKTIALNTQMMSRCHVLMDERCVINGFRRSYMESG